MSLAIQTIVSGITTMFGTKEPTSTRFVLRTRMAQGRKLRSASSETDSRRSVAGNLGDCGLEAGEWRTVRRRAPRAGQRALDARHAVTQYMESRRRLALCARITGSSTASTGGHRADGTEQGGKGKTHRYASASVAGERALCRLERSAAGIVLCLRGRAEAVKPTRGRQGPAASDNGCSVVLGITGAEDHAHWRPLDSPGRIRHATIVASAPPRPTTRRDRWSQPPAGQDPGQRPRR